MKNVQVSEKQETPAEQKSGSGWFRKLGLSVVALLLGLGLIGATATASQAAPTEAGEPAAVEAAAEGWAIQPRGQLIVDEFGFEFMYMVEGGYIGADGTGVLELSGGATAEVTYALVTNDFAALTIELGILGPPISYSGILDAVEPGFGIYDGALDDLAFGNSMDFDMPGLQLTPVR